MPSLARRYADLLPTLDDPALNRLVTDLDRAYGAEHPAVAMPPELRENLAASLARRAAQPPAVTAHGRLVRLPRSRSRRAGLAAILLAALLGGGVVGLALTQDRRGEYPYSYPGPTRMDGVLANYGHAYNLSRAACGYRVTITRVYADANEVTVQYAIAGPPGRTFIDLSGTGAPALIAGHGTKLRWLTGAASSPHTVHNVATVLDSFDAHAVARNAGPLHLRFSLPSFSLVEPLSGWNGQNGDGATSVCEHDTGAAWFTAPWDASPLDRLRAIGARLLPTIFHSPIGRTVNVQYGYSIPFTVPLDRVGANIQPNQAVTAGGVTLILDRVIATRSEMRVYLRRGTAGGILLGAFPSLSGADSGYGAMPLFGDYWTHRAPASRRYDFALPYAYYHPRAAYTLLVRPDPYATYPAQPWLALKGGPWTFHFRLP